MTDRAERVGLRGQLARRIAEVENAISILIDMACNGRTPPDRTWRVAIEAEYRELDKLRARASGIPVEGGGGDVG